MLDTLRNMAASAYTGSVADIGKRSHESSSYGIRVISASAVFTRRENHMLKGRRILVVEDEVLIFMHAEAILQDLGCNEITSVLGIDEAIEVLEHKIFDGALLDMMLNGEPCYPVADALAAKNVPFVFVTGYYTNEVIPFAHSLRPKLSKPYRDLDILMAFKTIFG